MPNTDQTMVVMVIEPLLYDWREMSIRGEKLFADLLQIKSLIDWVTFLPLLGTIMSCTAPGAKWVAVMYWSLE